MPPFMRHWVIVLQPQSSLLSQPHRLAAALKRVKELGEEQRRRDTEAKQVGTRWQR